MMREHTRKWNSKGFTLIEVLVGIVIFALGMMALASLQGNLARNSSDSNARTVGVNIAEEVIEASRAFRQVESGGGHAAYNDIVSGERTIRRGGNHYKITSAVQDYWWHTSDSSFKNYAPAGALRSDVKRLEVTVAWNANRQFQIDESNSTSNLLGSGNITLTEVISSITSPSGGKVILSANGDGSFAPPVDYNPGANPDIISIQLGANKFKESTTPLPDVIRADELVETRFDVVTYSQDDSGATFLRREEFSAVSCECSLRLPDTDDEGGLRPTVWDGFDYTEGEFVSKPYGVSANNQQSGFCDLCCRDHHDGGSGEEDDGDDPGRSQYNAFRSADDYHTSGSLDGDHKHYNRDRNGNMALADSDGDTYVEACRMIRKDGFFRIAQDLRQEGLNSFPADYLDDPTEVGEYSSYVTTAVSAYEAAMGATNLYEQAPPGLTAPADMDPEVLFPASTVEDPTLMGDGGTTEQQLRSRGIYMDYMSDVLRARINCLDFDGTGEACGVPGVTSALEIMPFYDVQLTWLSRWTESPTNTPVEVTNEAIKDNNTHDRGIASLTGDAGEPIINAAVHPGNLGLTGTDPIDPWYTSDVESYNLFAKVGEEEPPVESGYTVVGSITSAVGGVKAADVEIATSAGVQCDRTNTGYECLISYTANNPRLTVSNYFKRNKTLVACSDQLSINGTQHSGDDPTQNWTRFNLFPPPVGPANIVIRANNC